MTMHSVKYINMFRGVNSKKFQLRSTYLSKTLTPIKENYRFLKHCALPKSFSQRSVAQIQLNCLRCRYLFSTSSVQQNSKHDQSNQDKQLEDATQNIDNPEKLSLFKRYRKMLKEYWYVLIPVHMVTSAVWFGGFYYAAKSGIDIVPLLQYMKFSESLIAPFRNSSLGYLAVASALYKLSTPARYMVTLGVTTFSVKYLTKRGLIKPAPTKEKIKSIIQNKLKKDSVPDKEK